MLEWTFLPSVAPSTDIYIVFLSREKYIFILSLISLLDSCLQLLARQNKTGDTADVARPPGHRAKEAQRLRLDVRIAQAVCHPRQGVPQPDGVDGLIGDARNQLGQNCIGESTISDRCKPWGNTP